jgi:nicotinamidase-related amidase
MHGLLKTMANRSQVWPASAQLGPSPTVLLLVDVINPLQFEGAAELAPSALAAAAAIAKLKRSLAHRGCQSIYANDNYGVWRADFKDLWSRCSRRRGASGRIATLLKPRRQDFTLLKPRHSAFYSTPLDLLLQLLRCKRLIVAGIAADNCVLFTAMDAYVRGYSLWVPLDCVAAESEEAKSGALEQMQRVLKARIEPMASTNMHAT